MEPHGISHSHNHYMPTQNHPLLLSSIAMAGVNVPNQFLLTAFEDRAALCNDLCGNHSVHGIKNLLLTAMPRRNEEVRNTRFRNTLDTIVAYKSFRSKCREVGGCGCGVWLRRNTPLNKKERSRVTEKVRHACYVYDNWDTIVNNLTNRALTDVDCRDFTIKKFYEARNFSWCLKEQRQNSGSAERQPDADKEFDQTKFDNIVNHVKRSRILDDVSFDEEQAALICKKLKSELLEVCKAARQ